MNSEIEKSDCKNEPFVTPAVFANETDDGYDVRIEIPGVGKEDVELHVDGRTLSLKTRANHAKPAGFREAVREFGACNYAVSLDLPDLVDPATISARVADGVLAVAMKKRAELRPRKIEIA